MKRLANAILAGSLLGGPMTAPARADATPPEPGEPDEAEAVQDPGEAPEPVGPTPTPAPPAPIPELVPPAPSSAPEVPALGSTEVDVPADRPRTLFDGVRGRSVGGFGGVGVFYTRFASEDALAICGEGAVLIDHALSLGGGGCGVVTPVSGEAYGRPPHDPDDRLDFGYGGFIGRYHFFSREIANVSLGLLIGAGGVVVSRWEEAASEEDRELRGAEAQGVFIVQPELGGYLNITRWLRFGATFAYRGAAGVVMDNLSSGDVAGPLAGLQLQGGAF